MTHNRRSIEEEKVLSKKGIEWVHPFGYVESWDGQSGAPCSYEYVMSIINYT